MSITNYIKNCTKTIAGNLDRLFIVQFGDIETVTFSGNVLSGVTMKADKHFALIETDLDNTQFTTNGEASRGYFSEQNLIAKFSQKTTALETLIDEFIDGVTCGLVIIRVDSQGNGWISGIAPLDKMFSDRPWLSVTEEFDSGENIESVDEGNRYTVTFGRKSATREFKLVEDLTNSLVQTKDATFVDWPA